MTSSIASTIMCFTFNVARQQQLRSQLHQLHFEADTTRAKANNARLRFLRLSEAAEKIQHRAANCVRTGNEDEARSLLFQKKRILQALLKSKSRIALFEELLSKLNEGISVKETQLIENVNLDFEGGGENAHANLVRIISPKQEAPKRSDENKAVEDGAAKNLQLRDAVSSLPCVNDGEEVPGGCSSTSSIRNENGMLHKLMEVSSFQGLLKDVDEQLGKIETELDVVLRMSTILLECENNPQNVKMSHIRELRDSIRCIRERLETKRRYL